MTQHKSVIWHPFTQHGLGIAETDIDRAQGAVLYRQDESEIIDAISSWWVITHGHCHPDIVSAVQQQAAKLDQVIFAGFTHRPAQDLANKLLQFAGDPYRHVFYSDSGSTAVEVAMKMAIGYWQHRGEKRTKIIALEGAYHGDTFGTMAAGERCVFNAVYDPYLFEVIHTPVPLAGDEDRAIEALKQTLKQHGDDVAFFIFEPLVQGAGGMRMYSPAMLKTMCDLCRQHGILLLADEVMTGFGRTGTVFACQQAGVQPDVMAISKGLTGGFLPLGATLATRALYDAFYHEDRAKMFFHSSSFTGNPMACAAAYASLKLWDGGGVQTNIDRIVKAHQGFARRLETNPHVSQIRQTGTIIALEVIQDGQSGYLANVGQALYKYALDRGVLLRALGSVIYILPPYCITDAQLEKIYQTIEGFLSAD